MTSTHIRNHRETKSMIQPMRSDLIHRVPNRRTYHYNVSHYVIAIHQL